MIIEQTTCSLTPEQSVWWTRQKKKFSDTVMLNTIKVFNGSVQQWDSKLTPCLSMSCSVVFMFSSLSNKLYLFFSEKAV
jgi:hypothetical protein